MAALLLCLGLLLAAVQFSPVDSALPCNHPLRKYFPVYFGHCQSLCSYGPWGPWQPSVIEPNATCLSGKQRKYNRTRAAVPASNCPHTFEYLPECKQPQTSMNLELSMYCCVFFLHRYSYTGGESNTAYSITSPCSRCQSCHTTPCQTCSCHATSWHIP